MAGSFLTDAELFLQFLAAHEACLFSLEASGLGHFLKVLAKNVLFCQAVKKVGKAFLALELGQSGLDILLDIFKGLDNGRLLVGDKDKVETELASDRIGHDVLFSGKGSLFKFGDSCTGGNPANLAALVGSIGAIVFISRFGKRLAVGYFLLDFQGLVHSQLDDFLAGIFFNRDKDMGHFNAFRLGVGSQVFVVVGTGLLSLYAFRRHALERIDNDVLDICLLRNDVVCLVLLIKIGAGFFGGIFYPEQVGSGRKIDIFNHSFLAKEGKAVSGLNRICPAACGYIHNHLVLQDAAGEIGLERGRALAPGC